MRSISWLMMSWKIALTIFLLRTEAGSHPSQLYAGPAYDILQASDMTRQTTDLRGAHLVEHLVGLGGCGWIFRAITAGEIQIAKRFATVGVAFLRVHFAGP
jgi:hypothetical protein